MRTRIEDHFDVNRIIGIKVVDKKKTSYSWLPKKQKTFFFGLIKRDSWFSEGFYYSGYYEECYESGCYEASTYTKEQLLDKELLIDENNDVWNKPHVTVYLEEDSSIERKFNTFEDAIEWCEEIKKTSGKTFEIVRYEV